MPYPPGAVSPFSLSDAASCRLVARRAVTRRRAKLEPNSRAGQHIDESFDAEQVDFPANEIADSGLGYSKGFRRGVLRQLAPLVSRLSSAIN